MGIRKIDTFIRGRVPLIVIDTIEVLRLEDTLIGFINNNINKKIDEFDIQNEYIQTHGYRLAKYSPDRGIYFVDNEEIIDSNATDIVSAINSVMDDSRTPAIYLFPNIHVYFEDMLLAQQLVPLLSEALRKLEDRDKYIILSGNVEAIPREILINCGHIDFKLPDKAEIEIFIRRYLDDIELAIFSDDTLDKFAELLCGLTITEVEVAFKTMLIETNAKLIKENGKIKNYDILFKEKANVVKKSGLLEVLDIREGMEDVGGMEELKDWANQISYIYKNIREAQKFGVTIPKGTLITGISGCGKSLFAKAIAKYMEVPLYRLDVGRLFGSLVGETEKNTRELWKLLESIAPATILLDEIEKMLSGMESSGATDNGVTSRFIGSFLYYMEERDIPVFFVATANSIEKLPPELLRKGRWDELWFVDLPDENEREEIIKIHLRKRGYKLNENAFKSSIFKELIRTTQGFTGAELEQCVEDAIRHCFINNKKVKIKNISDAATKVVPLSKMKSNEIIKMRKWASENCRKASVKKVSKNNKLLIN